MSIKILKILITINILTFYMIINLKEEIKDRIKDRTRAAGGVRRECSFIGRFFSDFGEIAGWK